MDSNDELLNQELRRDEGVKYSPYLDTVGIQTVGIGHNLKSKPIPISWKYPLSDSQVNQLLSDDLKAVFDGLNKSLPWWTKLSYARQRALANMAFNLGINGLLAFKNTLKFIHEGNYDLAAEEMLSSKWAAQVKDRAKRLSKMMEEG